MANFRVKGRKVNAMQWQGNNLAAVRAFLGYGIREKNGWLVLPGGNVAVQTDWIVIGDFRNIYAVSNAEFTERMEEEKPQNKP